MIFYIKLFHVSLLFYRDNKLGYWIQPAMNAAIKIARAARGICVAQYTRVNMHIGISGAIHYPSAVSAAIATRSRWNTRNTRHTATIDDFIIGFSASIIGI
jgi:hypothetical protein